MIERLMEAPQGRSLYIVSWATVSVNYKSVVFSTGSMGSLSVANSALPGQRPDTMTSFKSQLEFLLTSQERREVKRALQQYKDNK